jgi:hypothetical protein
MEKTPTLQQAIDAMAKLSTGEKLKLAEAIGHSIPDIFSDWIDKKYNELYEDDEDDIRLAEEALEEYRANPASAIDGDLFFRQLKEKYGKETPASV